MRLKLLIGLIVLFGFYLRIAGLQSVPLGLSENEAAIGYNAYSILKTGRDEDSKLLPLAIRSFGDYKLGLPIYLSMPAIQLLGLNELAVRITPALVGSLSIILIFLLAQNLTGNKFAPGYAALALALSPWHVQISRTDFSVTLSIALLLLQLIIIFSKFNNLKLALILLIEVGLLLSHPAMAIIEPILLMAWFIKNKQSKALFMTILISVIMLFLIRSTLGYFYLQSAFFREIGFLNRVNALFGYANQIHLPFLAKITENKLVVLLDQVTQNYLKGFDFYYWFSRSDFFELSLMSNFGKFYSLELVFVLFAVYKFIKTGFGKFWLVVLLLIIVPLPGVLNLIPNFAQTLFVLMIPFYLLAAYGAGQLSQATLSWARFRIEGALLIGLGTLVILIQAAVALNFYFVRYPVLSLNNWNYQYKLINLTLPKLAPDQRLVISDSISTKPYIFTLFYQQIDPAWYQSSLKNRGGSKFISTASFGQYEFRSIDYNIETFPKNYYLIGFNDDLKKLQPYCDKNPANCSKQFLPDQSSSITRIWN